MRDFFRKVHIVYRAAQAASVRILHMGVYFHSLDRVMAQGFCVLFRPNPATLKHKSGMYLSSEGDSCTYSTQLRKAEYPSYGTIVKSKIKNNYVYNIFQWYHRPIWCCLRIRSFFFQEVKYPLINKLECPDFHTIILLNIQISISS